MSRISFSLFQVVLVVSLLPLVVGHGCPSVQPPLSDTLGLEATNAESLDAAAQRFSDLLATQSRDEARLALVATLAASDPEIVDVELASDGYSVRIEFRDGTLAVINTFDAFASEVTAVPAADANEAMSSRAQKPVVSRIAREITSIVDCPDMIVSDSKKVKIVNAAAMTNTTSTAENIRDMTAALVDLGWDPADIDVRARSNDDNFGMLLTDLLDHRGYGVVIYIGHGGKWVANDGQEHHHIQAIAGGPGAKEAYTAAVGQDEFDQWLEWQDQGKCTSAASLNEEGKPTPEVWIRDDLLAEQMTVDPGTMTYFISCNSWNLQDVFADAGVDSFAAWEGKADGGTGPEAFLSLIETMSGETPLTDEQAFAQISADAPETFVSSGGGNLHQYASSQGDYHLPSWGKFLLDDLDVPDGTETAEVTITYPDCPDASVTFTIEVGEELDVSGLIPGDAILTIVAKDASGNVLGTGLTETVFRSGGNNSTWVETCSASLALTMDAFPEDTATVEVEIAYVNPDIPSPDPLAFPVDTPPSVASLMPGSATISTVAKDASGQVIGYSELDQNIACGANDVGLCLGWATLEPTAYPPDTAELRVTASAPAAFDPVTITPGATAPMVGLTVNESVTFTTEAFDSLGKSLGTHATTTTIACGENTVELVVTTYDIVLEIKPTQIEADGVDRCLLTATLRSWLPGDTGAPTGDPIVGKSVEFVTSLGDLVGPNPVASDASGQATIELTGTVPGQAIVRAVVFEDGKEAVRVVRIGEVDGYFEDFEGLLGLEWSHTSTGVVDGSTYLGPFYDEEVELRLDGFPGHNRILVSFDVIIIGPWTGRGCTLEDFPWYAQSDGHFMGYIDADVGSTIFNMDYSRGDEDYVCCIGISEPYANPTGPCLCQDSIYCDDDDDPAQYGASKVISDNIAIYHVESEFQHIGGHLVLRFWQDERMISGIEWYGIDVSAALPTTFGIDNLEVRACIWPGDGGCTFN